MTKTKTLLQDETLAKKLITKGFWVYFFTFFVAPIGYILRMLVSNTLTVAEVGIFYSVLGLVGLIATYNDLGLTEALQYFIPKHRIAGEKAKVRLTILTSFVMQMLTGVVIFWCLYFGAEWLATLHFHDIQAVEVIRILAFYFLGYNILTLCSTIFTAFQDTFASGLTNFIQQISNLIFTIIFWTTASLTLTSYAVVWIIGVVVAIIVGVGFLVNTYRGVFIKEQHTPAPILSMTERIITLKQHFGYALWVFLVANVANLLGQVDQQVVVNVLGTESAGLFSNFQALLMVFILVVSPLFSLMFPLTTELIAKKDTQKFGILQRVMYTYFGAFALMLSGFFVVFGQEISVFLFGEAFRFSGYMLQFAAPFLVFNCWATISINMLAGLGKIKQRLGVVALALGVNVLLNLIFLVFLRQGLLFSAMILSISWVVMALGAMMVIHKSYPFYVDKKFLIKNVGLICLLILIMWKIKGNFSREGRWELLGILSIFFVGYGGILLILNWRKVQLLVEEIKKLRKKTLPLH